MKELLEILKNENKPYEKIELLYDRGELNCDELLALAHTDKGHKNNFYHTLKVLKNVCDNNYTYEMKIVGLFHDIGKPKTKTKLEGDNWSFHNHEAVGAKMFKDMCNKYNVPIDFDMFYVYRMILHHGRIKMHRDVTDSAIRRLDKSVGEDIIFNVINFSICDITTRYEPKRERIVSGLKVIENRINEVRKLDKYNAWRSPLTGHIIIGLFNNNIPGRTVGEIKAKYELGLRNGTLTLEEVIEDIKRNHNLYENKI